MTTIDWKAIDGDIIRGLNIAAEAESLGIRFSAASPNHRGWRECFAIDRDEAAPSAAVNVASNNGLLGKYTDLGAPSKAISFFEMASRLQPSRFIDWKAAREFYATLAGVTLPTSGKQPKAIADKIKIIHPDPGNAMHWHYAREWAKVKPGVSAKAATAAGLRAAQWPIGRSDGQVVAFSAYMPGNWEKPVGIILYRLDGSQFPPYKTANLPARKAHIIGGSRDGLIPVGSPAELSAAAVLWLCEGLPDALTLAPFLPAGHFTITTTCGAGSFPADLAPAFAGKAVNLVRDADKSGEAGAIKVAAALLPVAGGVKQIRLPYPVADNHGKDLRDFFADGHTIDELLAIADQAPSLTAADVAAVEVPATKHAKGITNANLVATEDGSVAVPMPMSEVLSGIRGKTDDWPRRVNGKLFIHDHNGATWLRSQSALFGWLGSTTGIIKWHGSSGCVAKEDVYNELARTATEYQAIESNPHEPPIAGHYYAHDPIEPGDGSAMRNLLDRFSPETDLDADLILSAFMTVVWGGPHGKRPCFVITSDGGSGAGKSTVAEKMASLFGGYMDFSDKDDVDKNIKPRMLSPLGLKQRIAVLDNVRSLKFAWSDLEKLITAPAISGKEMYVGEGSRPNTIVWFVTLNGAALGPDMARRSVVIKIKPPKRTGAWDSEIDQFISKNRMQILGDLIGRLREPALTLENHSTWPAWEAGVLARLPDPTEAQSLILERQKTVNVESQEIELVEDRFRSQLQRLDYVTDYEVIHVPSDIAAKWFNWATNENKKVVGVSTLLNQYSSEKRTKRIAPNPCHAHGRGYLWIGENRSDTDGVRYDLKSRMEIKKLEEKNSESQ